MKPGDIVMVVKPKSPEFAGAVGAVVRIERPHRFKGGGVADGAKVEFPRAMPWSYPGKDMRVGWIRLWRLKVLDGPEGQDETLTWKPVPQPVKETQT